MGGSVFRFVGGSGWVGKWVGRMVTGLQNSVRADRSFVGFVAGWVSWKMDCCVGMRPGECEKAGRLAYGLFCD